MTSELDTLLAQLPEGADIFVSVQQYLNSQVYPDLGSPFWAQVQVLVAFHTLAGILFLVGLAVKAKRGRLSFIVKDGSCSRVDLTVAAPILWTCAVILEIIFAVRFKEVMQAQYFTRFVGAAWYLVYVSPAVSYTLLSSSVAASAPPVRRYLSRVSYGVARYNLAVAFVVGASMVGIIWPAMLHAKAMIKVSEAHKVISQAISAASETGDIVALMGVMDLLPLLEKADVDYRHISQVASGVYSAYMFLYLITGAIPAVILARSVQGKITRLEANKSEASSASTFRNTDLVITEHIALPVFAVEDGTIDNAFDKMKVPEQPKDRPFGRLIEVKTTPFPHRFQVVLDAGDMPAQQRADNLRKILKTDLILVSIYFLTISIFLGGCLFMAFGGLKHMDTRKEFVFCYSYFTWTFAVASTALAGWLFWDAVSPSSPDKPFWPTAHPQSTHSRINVLPAAVIQCSQIVNVSYAGGDENNASSLKEKKSYGTELRKF